MTLAADARLNPTDYTDDQIWELHLGGGEPTALTLQTTYGLRAHWMRLFPRFLRLDEHRTEINRTDPATFFAPPRIVAFYPNCLSLQYAPFEGIEVSSDYWVPDSHIVAGQFQVVNHSVLPMTIRFEWAALLSPMGRQGGMLVKQVGPAPLLSGETAYLSPVVVLTGGAQAGAGPYPSLNLTLELYPGNVQQFSWAAAAFPEFEKSVEAARATVTRPIAAELTRIEMINLSDQVQIQTGSPDWDAALALSQTAARRLLMQNPGYLPQTSFVLNRQPDQGFSVRGDGNDHSHLWSGQTAFDSAYLASLLLPGMAETAAGLLENFLNVQDENGSIDWKPGLGGQRSRLLAQPMLASLAEQIGVHLDQPAWYQTVFPYLLNFFNHWFSPQHDRDQDGFPEWDHPVQTGMEDLPIYDRWSPNAQGMEISSLESPGLAAMLLHECHSLIHMAQILDAQQESRSAASPSDEQAEDQETSAAHSENPVLTHLRARETALLNALAETWDEAAGMYHYRDYQTHQSAAGEALGERTGSGDLPLQKRFDQPARLVIHLQVNQERTYTAACTIYGFSAEAEIQETIPPRSFSWSGQQARATTQTTFLAISHIQVDGLAENDQAVFATADTTEEDCSLFLPLWAGAATTEQAQRMVETLLSSRYSQTFGIPFLPIDSMTSEKTMGAISPLTSVHIPWNQMIIEGLLRYGYRAEAADLFTRLMNAVVLSLKSQQTFRQYYQATTGADAGERGHLHGLAPVGLFLQTLGIRQLSPKAILLDGFNPYPWIINVQYRKVHLCCYSNKTEIEFPNREKVVIDQPGVQQITFE